jgi:hypothetical protein
MTSQGKKFTHDTADVALEAESDYDSQDLALDEDDDEDDIEFVEDDDDASAQGGVEEDSTFRDFVNPTKTVPKQEASVYDSSGGPATPLAQQPVRSAVPPAPKYDEPSEGFASIDEEKMDLVFKLDRLRKRGIPVKSLDFRNDIGELRSEVNRARSEVELESSIQFSRKMLMAVVSMLEFANKRFDPFDLELEGWSESVMQNVDNYDGVLEKLYYKYRNRVSMPPEMELMLSLAGSAFMFHMTKSMFKSLPRSGGGGGGLNADAMMRTMMGMMSQAQAPPPAPPPPMARPAAPPAPPPMTQQAPEPYRMKGPGMDLGGLMNMMPINPMPAPASSRGLIPRQDESDGMFPPPPPKPSDPPPPPPAVMEPPPRQQQDDRLSDIISEDLESVSDMSSISSLSSGGFSTGGRKKNVKNVTVVPAAPKGRRRAPKAVSGKVLEI